MYQKQKDLGPPHSLEAEQAILGLLLYNNQALYRVSDYLLPSHFFIPAHRKTFEVFSSMIAAGKLVSHATVREHLAEIENLDTYLRKLAGEATTIINADDYGRMIFDLALRRDLIAISDEMRRDAIRADLDVTPQAQIEKVEAKLFALSAGNSTDFDFRDHLSSRRKPVWLDMSKWDQEPVPDRQWAIRDRVPLKQAGLFSGEGGTGKSILELMKNVAHVTGRDWLGSLPEPGPALYLGAEDDADEIHIRLAAIAKHHGITFKELVDGGLHVLCLLGKDATLCAAKDKSGTVEATPLYRQIYEAAGDIKPKNISVDTLSRAFAGNEIDRVQVYAFANHMQALAKVAGGSVTVLSHPSLAGIASGSGLSGSTAWHGAFRFRQYLKGVKSQDGEPVDSDLRELEFKKNQYGPLGETVVVRYQNGLFLPEAGVSNLDRVAREAAADRVFLAVLARLTVTNRNVSHNAASPNYAPKVFSLETEAAKMGLGRADLERAMRRLFAADKIVVETYGKASNPHERIGAKND
jgi:RecA-family ATPase